MPKERYKDHPLSSQTKWYRKQTKINLFLLLSMLNLQLFLFIFLFIQFTLAGPGTHQYQKEGHSNYGDHENNEE